MPVLSPKNDPVGQALMDHWLQKPGPPILASSDLVEDQEMTTELFFRKYAQMPELEQLALQQCRGRVLDVGAGAGCHSLWLHQKPLEVHALDVSPGAIEVMKAQGLPNLILADLLNWQCDLQFDTLLFLMNGIGIIGTLDQLPAFFNVLDGLLAPGGQVLFDSSDLKYLYADYIDGIPANSDHYYGEINYSMQYRDIEGPTFSWLYVDFDTVCSEANKAGYQAELLTEGQHFDYLARLSRKPYSPSP